MIPEEFHDFFVASAGVAGALIGLLFVAVSVHPERVGEDSEVSESYRPSSALSALLNPLMISLLALVPELQVGGALIAFALIGILAVVGLLAGLLWRWRRMTRTHLVRAVLLLLGQGSIYVVEIVLGLRLERGEDGRDPAATLCLLVLILFAVGIERAWEFVGARMPGLWSLVALVGRRGPRH